MNEPRTFEFNCGGGWVVTTDGNGGGNINTRGVMCEDGTVSGDLYDAAIDGVEALVLAHACAGLNIMSPEYQEGLRTAINAIGEQFQEDDDEGEG